MDKWIYKLVTYFENQLDCHVLFENEWSAHAWAEKRRNSGLCDYYFVREIERPRCVTCGEFMYETKVAKDTQLFRCNKCDKEVEVGNSGSKVTIK